MFKDDYQASINMCITLEIKYKIKLTGVIDTLERAKKVEELLALYKEKDVILENINKCFNDSIQHELLLDKYKYKEKQIKTLKEKLK